MSITSDKIIRTQSVKFGSTVSPDLHVISGIGQGTILGPLIFIFYINDIVSVLRCLKINMYADDCILYCSGNDWNRMKLKIQPELYSVQRWYTANRLKINVKKSKVLVIASRQKLNKIDFTNQLCFDNVNLNFTNKYNYLGVIIDSEMTLTCLVSTTKKTVLNRLFNLRKLRRYITEKCALAIYKQTILPVFDYVGFMLISCTKSDRSDLQVIQNDALRTCYNVRRRDRLSVSIMHNSANLLSLEQRRTFQLLSLMYLHKNDVINLRIPIRNTRGADRDRFIVERYNCLKYKHSSFYKGAELWDKLPVDIASSNTLFEFKKKLVTRYNTYVDSLS